MENENMAPDSKFHDFHCYHMVKLIWGNQLIKSETGSPGRNGDEGFLDVSLVNISLKAQEY